MNNVAAFYVWRTYGYCANRIFFIKVERDLVPRSIIRKLKYSLHSVQIFAFVVILLSFWFSERRISTNESRFDELLWLLIDFEQIEYKIYNERILFKMSQQIELIQRDNIWWTGNIYLSLKGFRKYFICWPNQSLSRNNLRFFLTG